jgi:hypothetical protein
MVDKMKKKPFHENIMKEIEKLNSRNAARRSYKLINNTREHFKRRFFSYLPAYEDGTDRVFRNIGI